MDGTILSRSLDSCGVKSVVEYPYQRVLTSILLAPPQASFRSGFPVTFNREWEESTPPRVERIRTTADQFFAWVCRHSWGVGNEMGVLAEWLCNPVRSTILPLASNARSTVAEPLAIRPGQTPSRPSAGSAEPAVCLERASHCNCRVYRHLNSGRHDTCQLLSMHSGT